MHGPTYVLFSGVHTRTETSLLWQKIRNISREKNHKILSWEQGFLMFMDKFWSICLMDARADICPYKRSAHKTGIFIIMTKNPQHFEKKLYLHEGRAFWNFWRICVVYWLERADLYSNLLSAHENGNFIIMTENPQHFESKNRKIISLGQRLLRFMNKLCSICLMVALADLCSN